MDNLVIGAGITVNTVLALFSLLNLLASFIIPNAFDDSLKNRGISATLFRNTYILSFTVALINISAILIGR